MDYKFLNTVLKADRVLDIYLAEKTEAEKRNPIIQATKANEFIEALLANPDYKIINNQIVRELTEDSK